MTKASLLDWWGVVACGFAGGSALLLCIKDSFGSNLSELCVHSASAVFSVVGVDGSGMVTDLVEVAFWTVGIVSHAAQILVSDFETSKLHWHVSVRLEVLWKWLALVRHEVFLNLVKWLWLFFLIG